MQSVPKIVVKRLQHHPTPAGTHPDADLLTAFAEHSLSRRERALLAEHLATCADCREVVTLALPETESLALPASARTPRIPWLTWPTLRWVTLSIGILVVASAAILHYSHRNQVATVASNVMPTDAAPALSITNQALSLRPAVPSGATRRETSVRPASNSRTATAHKLTLTPNRPTDHAVYSGGSGGGMAASSGIAASPEIHQQVNVGASSEVVEVQAEATTLNTDATTGRNRIAQNQIAQNQPDLPIQGRAFTDLNVVKAKDPVPAQAGANASTAPSPASGVAVQTSSAMVQASPRWTVSPAGALQRSFDGGSTWQTVDPSTSLRHGMARAAVSVQAGSGTADQKKENLDQKVSSAPRPNPIFRAVAALGPEVWAGASSGFIYHSQDGGNRWILVTPSEAGTILTGDILSIQFSDLQHGRIATSAAELWTTFDAGQTWHKQP